MMYLKKDTSNTVILTLTERVSLSPAYFLFHLNSHASKKDYYFTAVDSSSATSRYNSFTIQNQISAVTETEWFTYKVYEQSSAVNINPALTGALVEQGLCFISGSTQHTYTKDTTGVNYTFDRT